MSDKPIQPIRSFGRPPEQGRIRIGVRSGKAMKAIDTFRFTSSDRSSIEVIAARYGGRVQAWSDPKASPKNQWEVITPVSEIEVFLPPEEAISQWYEEWSGGGVLKRCDGELVIYKGREVPCLCAEQGKLTCRPITRLRVMLPDVAFGGTWRLETKGWNAANELKSMAQLIEDLNERGLLLRAILYLTRRERMKDGQKQSFVVPGLRLQASLVELASGGGGLTSLPASALSAPALTAGSSDADEYVEAEIIEDNDEPNLEGRGTRIQAEMGRISPSTSMALEAAAQYLVHFPGLGNDDDVIDAAVKQMSRGKKVWSELDDAERMKVARFLLKKVDNDEALQS